VDHHGRPGGDTSRVRLGSLITPVTFRHPGPLAIAVAQIDAMSGGRVELSLGAGWFDTEHAAYGIPFPPMKQRFDMLTEQLDILTGLWTTPHGQTFSYQGEHYTVIDSPALPKPAQRPKPPIILGGHGAKRTPALAAKHADEFNLPFGSLDAPSLTSPPAARSHRPRSRQHGLPAARAVHRPHRDRARDAPVPSAAGTRAARNGAAGLPDEVAATPVVPRRRASRIYLQTSTSTTPITSSSSPGSPRL
jgi:alkanesulfonate monooxygenase